MSQKLRKLILKWAQKNEAIDKFGDILLQQNVNDAKNLASFLSDNGCMVAIRTFTVTDKLSKGVHKSYGGSAISYIPFEMLDGTKIAIIEEDEDDAEGKDK